MLETRSEEHSSFSEVFYVKADLLPHWWFPSTWIRLTICLHTELGSGSRQMSFLICDDD